MNKKKFTDLCIGGGIVALGLAILSKLTNIEPFLANPIPGLMKVATILLLAAIAMGVNKS